MELWAIRAEIEHMRRQILRQRREIRDLQRSEELLGSMQFKVDELCSERDRQLGEQRRKYPGTDKVIHGPIERRFR
jgi:hypothetical protein